jgi:Zn finger protein HypA/HybF involved in hydrogenase expression
MYYKTCRMITRILFITGALCLVLSGIFETFIFFAIGLIIMISCVVIYLKYGKCSNCKKYINPQFFQEYCPYCGERLI